MNLPRGTLYSSEECTNIRPLDYLSRVDPDFSGSIRFFERGKAWDVFFLLVERGFLIGYNAVKGGSSLEDRLCLIIERIEVEVRVFGLREMEIARSLNPESLFPSPLQISDLVEKGTNINSKVKKHFQDDSFRSEIKEAREFGEAFRCRRMVELSSSEA